MTTRPPMELADYVRELTEYHNHAEHYTIRRGATWYGANHVTKVPPLLHQLRFASASGRGEELTGSGFGSRPAASIESIDTAADIDQAAHRWVTDLGGQVHGVDTVWMLRLLNGMAASAHHCPRPKPVRDKATRAVTCCTWHAIEVDVRNWWTRARIVTGWDSPAWRPDNTCPMCGTHGGLRVKLTERIGFCTECHETWDETNIGLLADHIRAEAAGVRQPVEVASCWCPWPRPKVDAWPSLCPECASPWCHRARARGTDAGAGDTPEHSWVS